MRNEPGRLTARLLAWTSLLGLCFLPVFFALFGLSNDGHESVSASPSLDRTIGLFRNTLCVSGGAVIVAVTVGVPYGLLVGRTNLPGHRVFGVLQLIPLLMPPYVAGTGWVYALGAQGFLNTSAQSLIDTTSISLRSLSFVTVAMVLGMSFFPVVSLAVASSAKQMSRDVEDWALLVGGKRACVRYAVLPCLLPSVLLGGAIVFLLSAGDFGVPAMFSINVLTVEVYEQFSAYYNVEAALVAAIPLLAVATVGVLVVALVLWRKHWDSVESDWATPGRWDLGWLRVPCVVFANAVVLLAVAIPVAALLREASSIHAFSVAWNQSVDQIANSAVYGICAASLSAVLAVLIAYFCLRDGMGRGAVLLMLVILAIAVPACVTGVGLIGIWNRPGVPNVVYISPGIIILAFLARFLPVAVLIACAGMVQISRDLEDAARLFGANWARVFLTAILPYMSLHLLVGWMVCFALSAGELATAVLVSPPGLETLPVRIFGLMHFGASSTMAALSSIVIAVTLLPAVGVVAIASRMG